MRRVARGRAAFGPPFLLRRSFLEHPSALQCLGDSADSRRTTMINAFVSPLFEAGEVLLGLSITMFVVGLIATYGDSLRWRRR
jgi:hypothetical protein